MSARWAHTFKSLLAICILCIIGSLGFGFVSSRGDLWERFTIASAWGWCGSVAVLIALAVTCYIKLRFELRGRLRNRRVLTDQEFIDLSPSLKGVDPVLVSLVRRALAKQFRRLGGELFYPGDDFELDLKLSNLTFSLDEELEILAVTLAGTHGFDDEDFERELEMTPIQTYSALVVFLDRFWRRSRMKASERSIDRAWDHPLADRVLDAPGLPCAAANCASGGSARVSHWMREFSKG
jgi:hypothetical protein